MSRYPYHDRRDKNYLLSVGVGALIGIAIALWLGDSGLLDFLH